MAIRKRRRNKSEIERDRRRIADLYLKGWLQSDIGEKLGLAQSTISRDIKALHEQWQESALIDFGRAKAEELAKVDRLEREYWVAWERSCEDAESATHKVKGKIQKRIGEDGKFIAEQPSEVAKTSKGQAGDPRFLVGVQWCIERRCKILGLDAPEKHDVTTGGEKLHGDLADDKRVAGLMALYDAVRARVLSQADNGESAVGTSARGASDSISPSSG